MCWAILGPRVAGRVVEEVEAGAGLAQPGGRMVEDARHFGALKTET
jgi:hypothetical protein